MIAIARGAYADRAFDRLPILADALQDARCDDAELLAHCRGPGPHARGCWALDLVLGKGSWLRQPEPSEVWRLQDAYAPALSRTTPR